MKNILCDTFINILTNSIMNGAEIAKSFPKDTDDTWRDQWGCLWSGQELAGELVFQTMGGEK